MHPTATIVIVARNAAATIERAVASACAQGSFTIILVDDFSDDDTALRAQRIAGTRINVIRPQKHESLGFTRQTALEAVDTAYGVWLDADDELLSGRAMRLVEIMEAEGSDFVSDAAELWSGVTGDFIRQLPIPSFLKNHHPLARLFERNYLPAPGAVGFRTGTARRIGYDTRLHGAEDYDFLLRAVVAGTKISLSDNLGYRQFAYPQSLSRSAENQRRMCKAALEKHSYNVVRELYKKAGYGDRVALWGLVSMAMFRLDYMSVLRFLYELREGVQNPAIMLEPQGPWPYPESWRMDFFEGTCLLLHGKAIEALPLLERQYHEIPTAAGCNNLGVAKWRVGDKSSAIFLFQKALKFFPGYMDAKGNLDSSPPSHVTTHPLRAEPARMEYYGHPYPIT